jgi:serine/threonine protein kinase
VELFAKLRHPNIIRLLSVRHEPDCHLLVLELAENDLKEEMANGPLPEDEARGYFRQVADAVQYCHGERQMLCPTRMPWQFSMCDGCPMQASPSVTATSN